MKQENTNLFGNFQEYDQIIANTLNQIFKYVDHSNYTVKIRLTKKYIKTYECKVFLNVLQIAQSLYPFKILIDCPLFYFLHIKKGFLQNKIKRNKMPDISFSSTIMAEIKKEMGIVDNSIFEEIYMAYYKGGKM